MALIALALAGCSSGNFDGPIELSWRFADDRGCDLAGVSDIVIGGAGPNPARAVCSAGLAPGGHYELFLPERPTTLIVAGHSISGVVMYAGELELDGDSAVGQVVTLRFTGGRAP